MSRIKSWVQSHQKITAFFVTITLLCALTLTARFWIRHIKTSHYHVFDLKKSLSWRQLEGNFFRMGTGGRIDNKLLSEDEWESLDLSFNLKYLRNAAVVTHFLDDTNFYFISLFESPNVALWGRFKNGKTETFKTKNIPLDFKINSCRLKIRPGHFEFFINGQKIFDEPNSLKPAAFGFLNEISAVPPTLFSNVKVKGQLKNGLKISTAAPRQATLTFDIKFCILTMLLLIFSALSVLFSKWILKTYHMVENPIQTGGLSPHRFGWKAIIGFHLAAASIVFWPFLTKGSVLISSYDNIGEILPLFFYSKHVFMNWFHGVSSGLWCPLAHDGMPFFTSHWNMAFYPAHWPIFFAPDNQVMHWLTLKFFLETFFIGILAFGFFRRELQNDFWALICSLSYQLGSLLIFTLTIFPTISLFFAMTLYLYIVWSWKERRWIWNYLLITLTTYLILTSANVAFVFYAVVSLFIVTCYRCVTRHDSLSKIVFPLIGGVTNGFLIASIRLLPCFWGIMNSNRLVSDYFSIHDRFPLIVRLFVPSIAGWLGPDQFSVLKSDTLGWVFDNINPQSGFFIYYGILIALLIVIGIAISGNRNLRFWKYYAWGTILFALLWKPIWGVLSILFFPLNHYSYHAIILPLALCGFAGHVGKTITEQHVPLPKIQKLTLIGTLLFAIYSLIFLTYLFPNITPLTRAVFLAVMTLWGIWMLIDRYKPQYKFHFTYTLIFLGFSMLTALLFSYGTVLIFEKNFIKPWFGDGLLWPTFAFLTLSAIISYRLLLSSDHRTSLKKTLIHILLWIAVSAGIMMILTPFLRPLVQADSGLRIYIMGVINDHFKWALWTSLFLLITAFWQKRFFNRTFLAAMIIFLVAADLIIFNVRFDNITAPFGYKKAFYPKSFEYNDIDATIRDSLDLIHYRVALQNTAGLNANKNMIFDLPSYTGTMGYMPERFSKFIHAFGVPEETILIYPIDHIDNNRFLDLSSVRYLFKDSAHILTRESALPRMSLYYDHTVIPDESSLLKVLTNDDFNYHAQVLLAQNPENKTILNRPIPPEPVKITSSTSDKIKATIESRFPAILLFTESFDEGWKAFIDGKQTEIVPANYNFMAIAVPDGSHEIAFEYRPVKYVIAKTIHILGLLIVLIIFGFWVVRYRKHMR